MQKENNYEGPESYNRYGFSIVRQVLSPQDVQQTRALLDHFYKKSPNLDPRMLYSDQLLEHSPLVKCIFQKRVVEGLKQCLTNHLVFMPDFVVLRNAYGLPGWHTDCGSESGSAYLYNPDYKFAKCGIFLQDYDNGWGGGVYVKPFFPS